MESIFIGVRSVHFHEPDKVIYKSIPTCFDPNPVFNPMIPTPWRSGVGRRTPAGPLEHNSVTLILNCLSKRQRFVKYTYLILSPARAEQAVHPSWSYIDALIGILDSSNNISEQQVPSFACADFNWRSPKPLKTQALMVSTYIQHDSMLLQKKKYACLNSASMKEKSSRSRDIGAGRRQSSADQRHFAAATSLHLSCIRKPLA